MLIYAATIAVATLFTLRRPGVAAGLLLCTYGLEQWAQSQSVWFFQHGTLTNGVTASLVLLGILVQFQRGRPVLSTLGREFWLVAALTTYMLASTAWSISPGDTIQQFRAEFLYYAVFVIFLPLVIVDTRDMRDAALAVIVFGAMLATLLLTTSRWDQRSIVFQSGSLFVIKDLDRGNPLAIGTFGGYVALIALLSNFRNAARLWQVARYAVVALGFAVCVKSGSRGQTIAIVLAALSMMPYSRRFQNFSGFVLFGFSTAFFIVLAALVFDYASRGPGDVQDARWSLENSVDSIRGARLGMASAVLGEWVTSGPFRWVFGLGSSGSWAVIGFYPHVVPAEVLAELGVIGLALFASIYYFCYRDVREIRPIVRDDPVVRGVIACVAGIVLFELIVCVKEGSLISSHVLLGMAGVLGRLAFSLRREAAEHAAADVAGYAMTDEERLLEDEAYLDELYDPEPAGSRG